MEKEDEIIFQMYGIKGYFHSEEENEEKPDNEEISKKD